MANSILPEYITFKIATEGSFIESKFQNFLRLSTMVGDRGFRNVTLKNSERLAALHHQ